MILTISKAASLPFDCTAEGIKRCHGDCCIKLKAYWPMRAYPKGCPYVTPKGCSLSMQDRTIDCLLYPLFLSDGKLNIHNHCYHKKWMCHDNLRVGPPMINALAECLIELFGRKTYIEMEYAVLRGKSFSFVTSPVFDYCRLVEELSIKYDLPIIPRTEVIADFEQRGVALLELMEENIQKNKRPVSKHWHGGY